ncbi:MAG: T9SS type A sorting domain-containing protein [Bacteroidetes bacterium]|nr:T9SS type A sorting domain-containing protein [Bacteroidota bacterium]
MKKIVLSLLFASVTVVYAYSQSLSLSDSTGPVPNNSVYNKQGHVLDDEVACHIFVTNTTAHAISVIVKKVELGVVTGTMNTFCWGLCYPPNIFVSPPMAVPGNFTDSINFSGHYNPLGFSGVSRIRYVFYDEANPLDSVCVNVSFGAFPVGVQEPLAKTALGNAYPNPANTAVNFSYSVNTGEAGSIIIRNVLGSKVKEITLINPEGKISVPVSDLPEGIYFYSLNQDGKALFTRKLIIKH